MPKLLGLLLVASLCGACLSHARPAPRVESPDPVVGDLHCARSRLSLLEALYGVQSEAPEACDRLAR
jgi:hypothetical protein